jgi:formylmethanofuran dehydrogenase subunit B
MAMYLKGERADEASAFARAAELLDQARLPVIGGLLTDIAGAEAALTLARKLGGVVDHDAGEALSRSTRLMRETGAAPASFGEVRNRADIVVVVGDAPLKRDPGLINELFPAEEGLPRPGDNPRELVVLGGAKPRAPSEVPVTAIALKDRDLPTLIAMLAMAVAGRPVGGDPKPHDPTITRLAERLRGAAFPVFVYSALDLQEPAIHVVFDMVRHLCLTTRAATLTLAAPGNGDGVNLCSAWTCGLPMRTRFVDGLPEHDPWLYATDRLIGGGEADALLWVDALEAEGSEPPRGVPTVLLTGGSNRKASAEIVIEVATAARDHDAELYLPRISGIGVVKAAQAATAAPTVAAALARIADLVAPREARPC